MKEGSFSARMNEWGGKTESDMEKNPHAEERANSNEKREGGFKWSGVHLYGVRCVSCMVLQLHPMHILCSHFKGEEREKGVHDDN